MQEADIELSVPVEGAIPQVVLEEILKQKGLDKKRFHGRILGVPGAVARGHFVDGEGSHYFEHVRKTMFSQTNATRGFLLVQALAAKLVGSDPGFCKDEKICVVAPEGRSSVYILSLANQLSKFYDPIEDHDELEARDLPFYPVPVEDFIKRDGSIGYRLSKSSAIFCRGARSIIFVDLVNSGYTIHAVAQVLRDAGSTVAMACSFVNQGGQTAKSLGVREYYSLENFQVKKWSTDDCPACTEKIPVDTEYGRGKAWVAKYGQPEKRLESY